MRMLCAVLESTSGEVLLDGKEVTSMGADYRNVRIFVMPVERQIVFYLRHDNHERGECDTQPNDVEQRSDFVLFQYVEEIFQRCHDWQAFVVWLFGFNRFYRIVRRGFVAAKRDDRDDDA